MKYTTPASRAPGVPSLGMMQAEIASTSLASAGVRNSSFCDSGDAADLCACSAAARTAGQLTVAHVEPAAARVRERNCLRSSSVINVRSGNIDLTRLYSLPAGTSMQKNGWNKALKRISNPNWLDAGLR